MVQRLYPQPVGKLTCAEFLTAYWRHVDRLRLYDLDKLDPHAEIIARDKHADLFI